jgi:integrase
MQHALTGNVPANTKRAYATDFRQYREWALSMGYVAVPATEDTIKLYITHLIRERGMKPSSVRRKMYVLNRLHAEESAPQPVTPNVVLFLNSALRDPGIDLTTKQAAPLRIHHLQVMAEYMSTCDVDPSIVARDKAIILTGWSCAMYRHELESLILSDLSAHDDCRQLAIRRSKTDFLGIGVSVTMSPAQHYPNLCPVAALDNWLRIRGDEPGPLFFGTRSRTGKIDRHKPLGPQGVYKIVIFWAKACAWAATAGSQFSPHSLRAGFATEAILAGIPIAMVMKRTRHRSLNTFMKYVRIVMNAENNITKEIL